MDKKTRIQELLNRLDVLEGKKTLTEAVGFLLDEEASVPRETLKDSAAGKAISQIASHVGKMRIDPRLTELEGNFKSANEQNSASMEELVENFSENIAALREEVRQTEARGTQLTRIETTSIIDRLSGHEQDFSEGIKALKGKNSQLETEVTKLLEELPRIYSQIAGVASSTPSVEVHTSDLEKLRIGALQAQDTAIKELAATLNKRINQIQQHGGGNANRSILVGADKDTLKYFTDINLKAGAGTTIAYAANQTTKYTDITITATGSGSGITRSVNSVAINTTAAATAGIDYVYLCTAGLTLTLPTAVGNSNLYTIKNTGSGTVIIGTTGGQTIDGDTTVTMPVQYTSVDLISNGSNWLVT